jgi:CrcB protein
MLRAYLAVAVGGALGSVLRYAIAKALPATTFPWATFLVNLTGAFVIGILAGWATREGGLSDTGWLLLATGFCGGFTTFSTFALENILLLRGGDLAIALSYTAGSLILGLLLCGMGYRLLLR